MTISVKECIHCKQEKPFSEFYVHGKYRSTTCKECAKKNSIKYSQNHPGMTRKQHLKRLAKQLGMLYEELNSWYNRKFVEQNGCCAICGRCVIELEEGSLSIDHKHNPIKLRGLLCHGCNLGLGNFQDDTCLLDLAKEYLSKNN
jgi:hypothetical protein